MRESISTLPAILSFIKFGNLKIPSGDPDFFVVFFWGGGVIGRDGIVENNIPCQLYCSEELKLKYFEIYCTLRVSEILQYILKFLPYQFLIF